MSKTYKCTLNMEGHGKSKSAGKKKKENKKKEEETEKKQEGEAVVKEVEDEKESAEKKKKREDQSVRLFHDDTFKGRSLEILARSLNETMQVSSEGCPGVMMESCWWVSHSSIIFVSNFIYILSHPSQVENLNPGGAEWGG